MRKAATKALYLFLCAILGMVLFAMLHRAIFVLYDLLIFVDGMYAFGLSDIALAAIDFFALAIALFLGGWYGTMMGIDWYAMVYGPNAEVKAGLFHGFIPHHWRGKKGTDKAPTKSAAPAPAVASKVPAPRATAVTTSPTIKVRAQEIAKMDVKEIVQEVTKPLVREWSFDDLISPSPKVEKPAPKRKAAAKKTVTKKVVRKTAKPKAVKTESVE